MTHAEAPEERLNRFLARTGVGSRRRADEMIAAGRVFLNGVKVERLATQVRPGVDEVTLDGKLIAPPPEGDLWIVLNKTAGTLTARRDVRGRPTVFDGLPPTMKHLITVGRLDFDTEGVILLTSDGHGAHRLMHPRYRIERVYEATVSGCPTEKDLKRLARGINLGDPTPARAEARILRRSATSALVRLTLREGRNREIKRMMEAIGHRVQRLKRVSFAGITVRGLSLGRWRNLTGAEMSSLKKVAPSIDRLSPQSKQTPGGKQ